MSQNSYPKVETPFTDDQWKNLFLTLGRGIIDKGGWPYKLTNRDSTTNMVTLGVSSLDGQAWAVLDGFVHHMDAPEQISVPPVTVDTTYEIGLIYDPQKHQSPGGPLSLTAWVAPGDTSSGKQYLVMYRMTRKNNLALGSTPFTEERPRAVPVFSVSQESQLPVNSLSLVDSLGIVRTTNELFRADMDVNGAITWRRVGGGNGSIDALANTVAQRRSDGTLRAKTPTDQGAQFPADTLVNIGWINQFIPDADTNATPNTAIKRFGNGAGGSVEDPGADMSIANKRYVDNHKWAGDSITSRVPFEHVDGSTAAYSNTNLGSTWTSVAVNSSGFLGRYPSALKYKKNIRGWNPDPEKIIAMTPVQYDVKQDVAGASGDSDQGLIGFVADSYVNTMRELVLMEDGEVEGFHYHLMPVAQQVVLRWQEGRIKTLESTIADLAARVEALETGTL